MAIAETAPRAAAGQYFERASFTGSASEYFGIWIVNVLLTIVTLGIYSAWAKVRRMRYFYGNTVILDRAFEYHATGKQIFIGRLIVIAFLIVINIGTAIFPPIGILTPIVILVALPWLIKRSLRFNARVTSYRNVRFDFVGTAGGAFVAILLGSFVAFISFGILAPLASRWTWRYLFNNLRYGDRPFSSDPQLGRLYGVWILPALIVFLGSIVFGFIAFVVIVGAATVMRESAELTSTQMTVLSIAGLYAGVFIYFILYGVAGLFYRAGVRNVAWSAAQLDGRHQLVSDISRLRYAWIAISNVIVTVLTLGLMRPWAAVRMARYVNEHSGIRINGDPGEILSSIEASGAAISAEYMDMEGFDFGF
ncbi:YjgN family protein [Neorhizobium galegae]|uniref:YjgN family protein n=1 Tax=Neorhizobium galegae TaxID=399 RepID=UPI002102B2CF|nr:YjgN family protein [Neorhizobium galegae]MCQ1854627.1 YjgN family protein [Neorhizobium galegae]